VGWIHVTDDCVVCLVSMNMVMSLWVLCQLGNSLPVNRISAFQPGRVSHDNEPLGSV
jgi:hypothetical protein